MSETDGTAARDDAMPDFERAVVYTPQSGDVVVLETDDRTMTHATAAAIKEQAQAAFGMDVKIVVLAGAHFAGVVRDEGNCPFCHDPLSEHTDAERRSCEMDIERRELESRMG